jgi:hypothetical protein
MERKSMRITMKERRSSARNRSFLQGRIFYNHRRSSVDCLGRDYSEAGARLKFSETITVPEAMELYIPNREEVRRARVEWRSGDEIGISFGGIEEAPALAPSMPSSDLAQRVAILEQDHATLKRQINELRAELRKAHGDAI